ncbi:ATP-binding protein [Actinoplanes sp. NPDC051633]|uniref:ATP-binding protein n=1 Tax=Actinoplanes sp. NPDC051633 TaxID=3155670 RepID=UPI0034216B92
MINTEGPTPRTVTEQLLPVSFAARHARNFVTEACLRWDLAHLIGPAALIINELVSNVVDHAHTLMTVEISYRQSELYLAVHDGADAAPALRLPDDKTIPSSGRGLILVAATATTWGYDHQDGGKAVWAIQLTI